MLEIQMKQVHRKAEHAPHAGKSKFRHVKEGKITPIIMISLM